MNLKVQSLSPKVLNCVAGGGLALIGLIGAATQIGATPHPAQPAPPDEPAQAPVVAAAQAPEVGPTVAPRKPVAALNSAHLTSWPLIVGQWRKVSDNGTDGSGYAVYQKGDHQLRLSYGSRNDAGAIAADQLGSNERPAATGMCGQQRDGGQIACYLRADQGAVAVHDVNGSTVADVSDFAEQLVPAVGTV